MPTAVKDIKDIYANDPDMTISGNVLANDSAGSILKFVDGARIGAKGASVIEASGTYGLFTFKPDGSYTYKLNAGVIPPDNGFTDTVSYKISDGSGNTDFDYLVVTIKPAITSLRPVAVDDSATVNIQGKAVGNLLDNDSDPDGGLVHVSRAGGTDTSSPSGYDLELLAQGPIPTKVEGIYGDLFVERDGTFTYQVNAQDADYKALNGTQAVDTFQYRIYDEEFHQGPSDSLTTDIGFLHINV